MPRSRKKRIHNDRSKVTSIGPKTRDLIECKCILHCNGSKWVDPRTFEKHQQEVERFRAIASKHQLKRTRSRPVDVGSSSTSKRRSEQEAEEESQDSSSYFSYSDDDEFNQAADYEQINTPTKRKRYHKFRGQTELVPDDEDGDNGSVVPSDASDGDSTAEDDRWLSDDEIPIEQFTAPDLDDFDFESDECPDTNLDSNDSWILLWVLKYQARFRLPDVAIDSLIKFFRIVLLDVDHERFKDFPTSSYMMRKLLEIGKQSKTYAVCPNCNKLYNISEISSQRSSSEFKCNHVEFPNHPRAS